MKSFIRILIVSLISSTSLACSWYPFGDDIRFSLMTPSLFDDGGMSPYYYTAQNYGSSYEPTAENDPNIALWKAYCKGQVDDQSIFKAVYELSESQLGNPKSTNKMVQYLMKNDKDALSYLAFAKSCSELNSVYAGWELEDNGDRLRTEKMLEAIKRSEGLSSNELKKRYRFLALRLAYYNNDSEKVKSIYRIAFRDEPKDALDYWALYFKLRSEGISAKRNFELAQVFAHAPGKRFGALEGMSGGIPIDEVLAYAKTDEQRANVHIVYAVRNSGRGLSTLKAAHQLDPKNPLLEYLLVREINTIEDWVLTPRYTNFDPALNPKGGTYGLSNELIQERIRDDEKYAAEVRNWLESLNEMPSSTWTIAKAYLKGITGKEQEALTILNNISSFSGDQAMSLAKQLSVLFKVKLNADELSNFNASEQSILMNSKQENYDLFLFAVSRELEFQKKLDVAAALFSQVNRADGGRWSGVSWKSDSGIQTLASDYYYSWFFYLDAEYSPEEIQSVIDFALNKSAQNTEFGRWQREHLKENIDRLYDLLGTKYVRQNNMSRALMAFQKVDSKLWDRDPFSTYLNANPFHADFYSAHQPSKMDTVRYNKLELVTQYQTYKTKANDPNTENRAYYYFLLGNCELNMSHHGNSWMMRRYYWTANATPNHLEDDDEYFRLQKAQDYYQKAYEVAKSSEVKALCLRMKGRCEKHQVIFDAPDSWDFHYDEYGGFHSYVFAKNQTYKKLINEFPDDAEDLMGYCHSFERYFARLKNS